MAGMTIAQLARSASVGVETVRYYQRRGLLRTPPKPQSSDARIRRYDESDVERLRFIRSAQTAGFALAEIGHLLAFDQVADRGAIRALAASRVEALDSRIAELRRARKALARLVEDCGRGDGDACPIIEAFEGEG